MAKFLLLVSYTSEAWANQIKNPSNRIEAVKPAIEKLGGKVESAYYAFGEYDLVVTTEFPDNVSASAFSISALAGGAIKAAKTIPLMSVEEGIEAITKAGDTGYKPPT